MLKLFKKMIYPIVDYRSFQQKKFLQFFRDTESWSYQQLEEYQLRKVQFIVYHHTGALVKTWDEFHQLPLMTKDDLVVPNSYRISPDSPYTVNGIEVHEHETSGSTGEPRRIKVPADTWHRKDAMFHRSWERLGRKWHDTAMRLIAGVPSYGWYDWWRNDIVLSRDISERHVKAFIRSKPKYIHGPGGAIRELLEEVIEAGREDLLQDLTIEWCSQSSEGHRERLVPFVKGFHEQYGLAELPTVGSPCLYNTHVCMETGVIESIDGELVVTDFNNTVMPVIRYRTGDMGEIDTETKCPCGSHHPILFGVKGRRTDYYKGPEVKRPIGWWIVSPISHKYGAFIYKWRMDIHPKAGKIDFHVKFVDGVSESHALNSLSGYVMWLEANSGLRAQIIPAQEEDVSQWKRDLVKVII